MRITRGKSLALLMVLSLSALLSACGGDLYLKEGTGSSVDLGSMTVAVLPFENLTNHQNAGQIGSEMTHSVLSGVDKANLVPLEDVRRKMAALDIKENDRMSNVLATKIGKSLGVDAVLIGAVAEYGYQYGLREEPSVTMSMRLVRTADGAVLWSQSAGKVGRGTFGRESVSMVGLSLTALMVESLAGTSPSKSDSLFWW